MNGIARAALLATLATVCWATFANSAFAEPSPSFSIQTYSVPTSLPRLGEAEAEGAPSEGTPSLFILATNVGRKETSGEYTFTDRLPTGLSVRTGSEPSGLTRIANINGAEPLTCSIENQSVTCSGNEELVPGESAFVEIPLDIAPSAPTDLPNVVEAEGGGSPKAVHIVDTLQIGSPKPSYGFVPGRAGLRAAVGMEDGSPPANSASHPYQATFAFGFPTFIESRPFPELYTVAEPKSVSVTLPKGMYANPTAVGVCTEEQLEADSNAQGGENCPLNSQVGVAVSTVRLVGTSVYSKGLVKPVFRMATPAGVPAEFAFDAEASVYVHLFGHVNSAGDYELSASVDNVPAKLQVAGSVVSLWGSPSDASHDLVRGTFERGGCLGGSRSELEALESDCSVAKKDTAFLTLPDRCEAAPQNVFAQTSSWVEPATFLTRTVPLLGNEDSKISLANCGQLSFGPTISVTPSTARADSPTGLAIDIHQPQNQSYLARSNANLRDATVALPSGVSVNPSLANGLTACTLEQIGYQPDDGKIRFSNVPQTCPNGSKIGTVEATTPLLDHPLPGSVYVMQPYRNPFNSLLGVYIAIEDEQSGIISKLAGKVISNQTTGQLAATFTENPDLPIEDVNVNLFGGDRAALRSPFTCGSFATTAALIPWSAPEGATVQATSAFGTAVPASETGACPTSEAAAPFSPAFDAGTVTARAGAYSPFVLRLDREDGEQHLSSLEATLPRGLLGKLAAIPYCSDQQIASARAREAPNQGAIEVADPSCPRTSMIGSVTVAAGAGAKPYYVSGKAYLAGPYKGAPLSMVVITPAIAGPFDLGDVVVRIALSVDPYSAQITAVSDRLPTILSGIPLGVRRISVDLSRQEFTLNPTGCGEKRIVGTVTSEAGKSASLRNRFQVGQCGRLGFKPKLQLSLNGPTGRTGHPAVRAVLTYPKKGAFANIARAQVSLPHSEFLDQANLDKVCTQPQLKSKSCPARSIYGHAKAWSPLLDKPLEGPIYLGVGFGDELPDLVAELDGQIRVLFKGRIDTNKADGIRNTFEALPDAPVSRVLITLKGGKKYGLIVNSENICKRDQRVGIRFIAHNGRVEKGGLPIANDCGSKGRGSSRDEKR